MPVSPGVARVRAKIAVTLRDNPTADVTDLRREMRTAQAEDYLTRLVNEAPPLTDQQRARLAALLAPAEAR